MVRSYFSDDYENVITQILEETDLLSYRIAISHEPLEIISIHLKVLFNFFEIVFFFKYNYEFFNFHISYDIGNLNFP